MIAEISAQARPDPHKNHVTVYAEVKQDPRIKGPTVIMLPRTEIALFCNRFQKSASDMDPVPWALMAMLKAL